MRKKQATNRFGTRKFPQIHRHVGFISVKRNLFLYVSYASNLFHIEEGESLQLKNIYTFQNSHGDMSFLFPAV